MRGDLNVIEGQVERFGELDLQLRGRASVAEVRDLYLRFGVDGLLRVQGSFALALRDAEKGTLLLARSPSPAPPIYWHQGRFSDALPPGPIDETALRSWVDVGLWPDPRKTAIQNVSRVPAGQALEVSAAGEKWHRFWAFSPLPIPRLLPEAEAAAELVEALVAVETPPEADLHATALGIAHLSGAPVRRARDFEEAGLRSTMRDAGHPLLLSQAAELASLRTVSRPLVSDLGKLELLGGTESAVAAYVTTLARAFDQSPHPRTLAAILRSGLSVDLTLERPVLFRALLDNARSVAVRWSRHLPWGEIELTPPSPPPYEPVTGDAFTDRRFAEAIDPGLQARHHALSAVRPVVAPFLEPTVLELLFSLPRSHFVAEGRMMRLLDGGLPIRRFPKPTLPRFAADHPFRRFGDSDRALGAGLFAAVFRSA